MISKTSLATRAKSIRKIIDSSAYRRKVYDVRQRPDRIILVSACTVHWPLGNVVYRYTGVKPVEELPATSEKRSWDLLGSHHVFYIQMVMAAMKSNDERKAAAFESRKQDSRDEMAKRLKFILERVKY